MSFLCNWPSGCYTEQALKADVCPETCIFEQNKDNSHTVPSPNPHCNVLSSSKLSPYSQQLL